MSKMVIICNHDDMESMFSTLVLCASGVALDNEVILAMGGSGGKIAVKGELEKIRDMNMPGFPDPVSLYNDIIGAGSKVILCDMALMSLGVDPEKDLREGVEVMNSASFLLEAEGATLTFTF